MVWYHSFNYFNHNALPVFKFNFCNFTSSNNRFLFFYLYNLAKKKTAQNIVIGGAAGALPPVIGWSIATGGVSVEPIILFLIIFFGHHLIFGH